MVPGPGPFSAHLGFRLISAADGHAEMEADPLPEHANGAGILHGGYLTALLDSTSGWAVNAGLGSGSAAPHVHLSVHFLRAGVPGKPLRAVGRCVRSGRRMAHAEAEVLQDGVVLARAITSHAVI